MCQVMNGFYLIVTFCVIVVVSHSETPGIWNPDNGQTHEEWLRCHGFSCDKWQATRKKLHEFKILTANPDMKFKTFLIDTNETLDYCIWLTIEQLDYIYSRMEEKLKRYKISSKKYRHGKSVRNKITIANFKKYPFRKWPTKSIYWKFDGEHDEDERAIIRGAFSHWQQQTCLKFKELGINEPYSSHYILVTRQSTGCHSFIGRIKTTPQQLNLRSDCLLNFGTPVHEIGHALGLWHQHQRSDRDSAIRILWKNVGSYEGQFSKEDTDNLTPYDYASVMHYAQSDGSINGKKTMETINPLYQHNIGQRTGLSFLDAKAINLAYCQDVCSVPLTECQHGGYQDPNDCSRCKCPDGLSGVFCDKLAPPENAVCGGDLTLSSTPLYIESPGYKKGSYPNHIACSWKVKAPQGFRISLHFEGEFAVYAYYQQQCHHWVEVRYKQDIGTQGPRFCGNRQPNDIIVSESDEMLIIFKTNWTDNTSKSRMGFRAKLEKVLSSSVTTTISKTTLNTKRQPTTVMVHRTTSTPSTVQHPITDGCDVVDLMLVVDSSEGVTVKHWHNILYFANRMVSQFDVSPQAVHIGVITYAEHANISLSLGKYSTTKEIAGVINAIAFMGGPTNTENALRMMRAQFRSLGRQNVRKIGILITDGQTALPYLAIHQASYVRSEGIQLYVVGVDKNFNKSEAAKMVRDKNHIFAIGSFKDLISPRFSYDIAVKNMICEVMNTSSDLTWSCDFDDDAHPLCDITQEKNVDQFDWTRQMGKTPSDLTGPDKAYTGNYYIYIEASDPRKPDDEAIIYLPNFNVEGRYCLSFAYSMYGFHTRTLMLAKKSSGYKEPLWSLTGEQSKAWQTTDISINLHKKDQIMIIGRRGDAFSGDIAIDHLEIKGGKC